MTIEGTRAGCPRHEALDSRVRGNDNDVGFAVATPLCLWIPACAGMTMYGEAGM